MDELGPPEEVETVSLAMLDDPVALVKDDPEDGPSGLVVVTDPVVIVTRLDVVRVIVVMSSELVEVLPMSGVLPVLDPVLSVLELLPVLVVGPRVVVLSEPVPAVVVDSVVLGVL